MLSLLLVVIVLTSCSTPSIPGSTILPPISPTQGNEISPNLVTLWHMDEGSGNIIHDATNNKNDGLINGATWVAGKKGSALSFNGVDNWVTISQTFIFHQLAEATISFWIMPSDIEHRPIFWTTGDNSDQNRYHMYFGWENQSLFGCDYSSASQELHQFGEFEVPINQWTHIVISRSGSDYRFYRNGQLVNRITDTNPNVPTYTGSWFIGRRDAEGNTYKGLIDEIAMYNCVLSPEEILNIYQF